MVAHDTIHARFRQFRSAEQISAAEHNAERNEVSARFADSAGEIEGQFDIVVANILSNPLKALAPAIWI